MRHKNATKTLKNKVLRWLLATFTKSFNAKKMTKSVLSMGHATIACLRNTGNSRWQAMYGTPGVRKGRQVTSENLRNTYQIFPIYFVCQLMLVENPAINTGTETQQSQISWQTALRKALQAIASIAQHLQLHSVIPGQPLKNSLSYIIVQICQGNCGRPVKVEEVTVVRSFGRITWTDKSTGKEKAKFGPMYIHFHENCLKNFSEIFYAPGQSFDFSKIKIDPKTHQKLTEADKTLLSPFLVNLD